MDYNMLEKQIQKEIVEQCDHNFVLDYKYEKKRYKRVQGYPVTDIYGIYVCSKCLDKREILLKQG